MADQLAQRLGRIDERIAQQRGDWLRAFWAGDIATCTERNREVDRLLELRNSVQRRAVGASKGA